MIKDLTTLLFDLKNKPHCMLPQYAQSLESKIEKYLAEDMKLPDEEEEEECSTYKTINGVAIIDINGIICKRLGLPEEILEIFGLCDLDNIDKQIRQTMVDDEVTAVVFNVTSPGGFLSGVASTAALIGELSEVKETVVYSDVLNASAAYWLSSQANHIASSQDAEMGSVGVFTELTSVNRQLTDAGIDVRVIQAGKYKAMGHPLKPITQEDVDFIQSEVNGTWEQFKSAVNTKRKIAEDDLQGQTFSGEALIQKGFVDSFASSVEEIVEALTAEISPVSKTQ